MDRKTFICSFFLHYNGDATDMEAVMGAAKQRADFLDKNGFFSEWKQSASAGNQQRSGEHKDFTIKNPNDPPTENQIRKLQIIAHQEQYKFPLHSDERILGKDGKSWLSSDKIGGYENGRYTGEYTKGDASKVIDYCVKKMEFHTKILALMQALGKNEAEVQEELSRFSKTSGENAWDEILKAIESKQTTAAAVVDSNEFDGF